MTYKLEDARNAIQLRIVKALKEYRKLHAVQHRVGNRMIYPESLKYLSIYGLSLCKSTALRGGYADAQLDERCAAGFTMMALPVKKMLKLLYPSLLRVDEYLVKVIYFILHFFSSGFQYMVMLYGLWYTQRRHLELMVNLREFVNGFHSLQRVWIHEGFIYLMTVFVLWCGSGACFRLI